MAYIRRDMEEVLLRVSEQFKVVLVTGPRQVGKTTMLKKLMEGTERKYVTLDDVAMCDLAKNDFIPLDRHVSAIPTRCV